MTRTRLDLAQLTGWINTCLSGDRTKHSQKALHEIDADDNLVASTTFEIGKAEAAGYRLLGALTAVEDIRHDLIQRNINFSFKGIP